MKSAKTNFFQRTLALGALLAGGMMISQGVLACTLNNWSDSNGAVAAGDPDNQNIARYAGFCGMQVTGSGWVQDNSPGGIQRIVARFYVLNDNTGTAEIYAGYGDNAGGSERFNVTLTDSGTVRLTDTITGDFVEQTGSTNWLSVEVDWAEGAGNGVISLSVNGQTAVEDNTLSNDGTDLQSVRLGNLNGAAGAMNFDGYESRRSTSIGRLLAGDANNDNNVSIFDAIAVINESSGPGNLAPGNPDCNEDGSISVFDFICIVNVASGT